MEELKDVIISKVKSAFPDALFDVYEFRGELALNTDHQKIVPVLSLLKDDPELQFIMCEDVTAIDNATRKNRFSMVYHVYSMKHQFRLRIKTQLPAETAESITSVYPGANWYERETYDMFGIHFNNHPDHRRMYMPEDFEHFPLRKEFPLMGIQGSLRLPKK